MTRLASTKMEGRVTQKEMDEFIHRDIQAERDRRTVEEIKLIMSRLDAAERNLNSIKLSLHWLAWDVRRV